MLNLKLKKDVFKESLKFGQENNIGVRGHADGGIEEQLIGILGQNIICDALDLPLMTANGFDGGVDINLNNTDIDIKTMGRKVYPKPSYVNNLIASQLEYNADAYLFCSYHKTDYVLTICGWIDKESFKKKAKFYNEGEVRGRSDGTSFKTKANLYEIENKELSEINTLNDLKQVGMSLIQKIKRRQLDGKGNY